MTEKIKVAVIQASPVFMDLEASLAKAVGLIGQAAKAGANLVALGETWLPGYPRLARPLSGRRPLEPRADQAGLRTTPPK